ncbi:MAG: ThuA domain-containing protein [Pirellulales bacterium]|nr:ThuA domain-containing protein [Pirellulales bacterium]
MHTLLMTLGTVAALISAAPAENQESDSIRVLIVSGVDHPGHDWKTTAPAIRQILEQDKRFDVRIAEDPELLASDVVFDYDVLFLHFKEYTPTARAERIRENLVRFVKQGKGLFVFHFACGAFEDWPEYRSLVGRVWDQKTGHDPRGPFAVQIVEQDHPITRGMADFQADDELYTCLIGNEPIEVLATARSKVTGKDHPMAFVLQFGKGRVFHTPLGHDVRAIQMPGVAELIRRGCLWVAGRLP